MRSVNNAGDYKHFIKIVAVENITDESGFSKPVEKEILSTYAKKKNFKGSTLIINNTDFEKAYTNFTIRYPITTITRDMFIKYKNKTYTIEYLNNIDEESIELEMQAKVVEK